MLEPVASLKGRNVTPLLGWTASINRVGLWLPKCHLNKQLQGHSHNLPAQPCQTETDPRLRVERPQNLPGYLITGRSHYRVGTSRDGHRIKNCHQISRERKLSWCNLIDQTLKVAVISQLPDLHSGWSQHQDSNAPFQIIESLYH